MNKLEFTNKTLENLNNSIGEDGKVRLDKFIKLTNKLYDDSINDTSCCETLPCSYADGYNDAISKIKEEAKYINKQ